MLSYLGYFSTSFIIAVLVWPFASALLTLPILAGLYHRYHRLRFMAVAAAYLSVLYVLGLVAFTLYPMPDDPQAFCAAHAGDYAPQLDIWRFISDLRFGGLSGALQLVFNIVFFVPLGFVLTRWLRWRWWIVMPVGFLVSLGIETSQLTGFWGLYPCAYRQFDVDDLLTNTLGAMAGIGVAKLFGLLVPQSVMPNPDAINARPGVIHRTVTFIIDMIFVALVYFPLTLAVVFGFHAIATPLSDGRFRLFGWLTVGVGWLDMIAPISAAVAFLIFELLIPLTHHGQTLAGMFTHMTIETKSRHGSARTAFYAVRTVVLGLLFLVDVVGFGGESTSLRSYGMWAALILFVFGAVTRRMPWDMIPGAQPSVPAGKNGGKPAISRM
ncbi:VanZ family protein [Bifidobacterium sp. 64T4]|uniref:VanZ family protein n=1 Tax=Bifidobacterium pongonis TaxID=2834432 RepID=UPI001C590922|nr:VanZ family protein [Bifidobacterium pongonis]MBW3095027.1 VanZ family protein [Bifidobacterium pongonis]